MCAYEKMDNALDDLFELQFDDRHALDNYNNALHVFSTLFESSVVEYDICLKRCMNDEEYQRLTQEREVALEILTEYLEIMYDYLKKEAVNGQERD